jgi:hypothetical protein
MAKVERIMQAQIPLKEMTEKGFSSPQAARF